MKIKALFFGTFSLASFVTASFPAAAQSGSAPAEPSKVDVRDSCSSSFQGISGDALAHEMDHPRSAKQQGSDFEAAHSFGSGFDRPFGENRVYGSGIFNHSFGGQVSGSGGVHGRS